MKDIANYFRKIIKTNEGWRSQCPRCADNQNKFYWNEEKQVGCCFHHDCVWFYQRGGVTLNRALAFFNSEGLTLQIPEIVEDDAEADVQLPEEFKLIKDHDFSKRETLYSYLESRGLGRKIVDAARVGYCENGRWWGYLIFPVFNDEGKVVYHQKRRFKDREPKFHNPKSSRKSELVYRINEHVRPYKIILVESIINALTIENLSNAHTVVMALLGKSLSDKQKEYVLSFEKKLKEIVVALDGDARRDAVEIAEKFWASGISNVRIAPIPDGEDLNSLGRTESWERINRAELFVKNRQIEIVTRKIA